MTDIQVSEDVKALNPGVFDTPAPKRQKYNAQKGEYMGIVWDSQKEMKRAMELILLQDQKQIFALCYHVRFPLHAGVEYEADFCYAEPAQGILALVVEDCKGYRTREYKNKKKMFEAKYGVEIRET